MKTFYFDQLNDEYLSNLGKLLGRFKNDLAMNLDTLDGFFTALHCCPEMLFPGTYLSEIWGGGEMPDDEAFESDERA